MPPKKRAKKTFTFPVVNKHFYRYIGRTIQVADKWWAEKIFSIDDSSTFYIVEQYDLSHQFPQGHLFAAVCDLRLKALATLAFLLF